MHQPDFRDLTTGEFAQPWVYLHAIKDYTDMAAHLENHPRRARGGQSGADSARPARGLRATSSPAASMRDPLLRLLAQRESGPTSTDAERELILNQCFRANHTKMIEPYHALQAAARSVSVA